MVTKDDMHPVWQQSRIKFMKTLMPPDFWKDKTILELGAFNGVIGNSFYEMGAIVTCVEGKREYLQFIQELPHLKLIHTNLDTDIWEFGKFDIIINFGLLYHIEKHHEKLLENCIENCDIMFLESVVFDKQESMIYYKEESGIGQSLSGRAGYPTTMWIENILKKHEAKYEKHNNKGLNASLHIYDWGDGDSGYNAYRRRFWVINCKG
jgi:hypothetical protein